MSAYVVAVGLQLIRMTFGGFGPNNLIEVVDDPRAGKVVTGILLTALGVVFLTGVLVLVVRRMRSGRPLRRSMRLLVSSFALGLVMAAALFLSTALGLPVQELLMGRRSPLSGSPRWPSWSGSCTPVWHGPPSASSSRELRGDPAPATSEPPCPGAA